MTAIHCNYITGDPGRYYPMKEPLETMEYQMRNWYYFTWLSGDHIVEQHCHNHDKAAWVLKGEYPVSAYGLGGRQSRTDPKLGNIFDHHTVVYEYKSGARVDLDVPAVHRARHVQRGQRPHLSARRARPS